MDVRFGGHTAAFTAYSTTEWEALGEMAGEKGA
jgi:hypothetical protein